MPGRCLAPEKARSSRSPILSSTSVLLTWMNWIPGHASAPVFAVEQFKTINIKLQLSNLINSPVGVGG